MVVLGGAAVGLVAALGDDDEDGPSGVTTTSTTAVQITETGQELLDRLAVGRQRPLHLRFEADAPDGADDGTGTTVVGAELTVELWRSGDRVRQDVRVEAGGLRTELAAFELPSGNVVCQRTEAADWVCLESRSTATEAGEPAGLVEAAAAQLSGAEVTTSDETIGGREARCYAIQAEGASTLCVTEDGIPVRLGVQGQQLTATVIEHDVDDGVFELPAEVTAPTMPTAPPTTVADDA